jgi:hypothetical protein
MPELALVNLERAAFVKLNRAAEAGDPEALAEVAALFDAWGDQAVECWLCARPTAELPRYSVIGPEHGRPEWLVAALCCHACRDMDGAERRRKSLKMFRAMFSKPGKGGRKPRQVHFVRAVQNWVPR